MLEYGHVGMMGKDEFRLWEGRSAAAGCDWRRGLRRSCLGRVVGATTWTAIRRPNSAFFQYSNIPVFLVNPFTPSTRLVI